MRCMLVRMTAILRCWRQVAKLQVRHHDALVVCVSASQRKCLLGQAAGTVNQDNVLDEVLVNVLVPNFGCLGLPLHAKSAKQAVLLAGPHTQNKPIMVPDLWLGDLRQQCRVALMRTSMQPSQLHSCIYRLSSERTCATLFDCVKGSSSSAPLTDSAVQQCIAWECENQSESCKSHKS